MLSENRSRQSRRLGEHGARPQVGQAAFHRVGRLREGAGGVHRHERRQPVEVLLRTGQVPAALVGLEEVIVEEEDPDVPVGHQVELRARRIGVGVGAEQGVVHGVELGLVPDLGAGGIRFGVQHAHLRGPRLGVPARRFQVGFSRAGHGM